MNGKFYAYWQNILKKNVINVIENIKFYDVLFLYVSLK